MIDLYHPEHIQRLCKNYHLSPSKKYGQNYLIDPSVIESILEHAHLTSQDQVVEVGPGFGVLTEKLASQAHRVVAYEIEKKLQPYWQERQKILNNVEIIWGNVLHEALHQNSPLTNLGTYKMVSNLPYQITSPVLRLFLEGHHRPELMVVMVQKEVGERICAQPGDMSLLAVAVQYYATSEYIATVPRSAFWPSPEVDSAIIRLKVKPAVDQKVSTEQLFRLVRMGFASRRKVLRKNLEHGLGKERKLNIQHAFEQLKLNTESRAQELSIEEWQRLSELLK